MGVTFAIIFAIIAVGAGVWYYRKSRNSVKYRFAHLDNSEMSFDAVKKEVEDSQGNYQPPDLPQPKMGNSSLV